MSFAPSRARTRALLLLSLALLVVPACRGSSEAVRPDADARAPVEPSTPREPVTVTAESSRPLEVGDDIEPDPEVLAFLAPEAEAVRARAQRVVGRLSGPLKRGKPESSMGNFVADALLEGTRRVTGNAIDVCFTNSGGLRRDLDGGEVTEGLLVELMPFDNSVVVFDASAEKLEELVGRLAQRGDPGAGVRFSRSRGKASDIVVNDAPLGAKETYRVCTTDYVFEGGGNYPFEGVSNVNYTGVLLRDLLIQHFELAHRAGETIAPRLDGRVKEER